MKNELNSETILVIRKIIKHFTTKSFMLFFNLSGGRNGRFASQARWSPRWHPAADLRGNFIGGSAADEGEGAADGGGDGQADGRQHHRVPARVRGQAGRGAVFPGHLLPRRCAHVRQERPRRFWIPRVAQQELELQSGYILSH